MAVDLNDRNSRAIHAYSGVQRFDLKMSAWSQQIGTKMAADIAALNITTRLIFKWRQLRIVCNQKLAPIEDAC